MHVHGYLAHKRLFLNHSNILVLILKCRPEDTLVGCRKGESVTGKVGIRDEGEVHFYHNETLSEYSEAELTDRQRPKVLRQLEGWTYLSRCLEDRPLYGHLQLGLQFNDRLGRLTLTVSQVIASSLAL